MSYASSAATMKSKSAVHSSTIEPEATPALSATALGVRSCCEGGRECRAAAFGEHNATAHAARPRPRQGPPRHRGPGNRAGQAPTTYGLPWGLASTLASARTTEWTEHTSPNSRRHPARVRGTLVPRSTSRPPLPSRERRRLRGGSGRWGRKSLNHRASHEPGVVVIPCYNDRPLLDGAPGPFSSELPGI